MTAKTLGVRPATMSHLEQGRSLPTLPMIMALCQHYDVTPNYLLDDSRPIEPHQCDIWSQRDIVYSQGDWVEVPENAVVKTANGSWLCPLLPGASRFTSAQQAQRLLCVTRGEADKLAQSLAAGAEAQDRELERQLEAELLAQRKPRGGRRSGSDPVGPESAVTGG